ncbi:MAG: vanadium-dependent haloperoxidase [Ginsengibacter sp.]
MKKIYCLLVIITVAIALNSCQKFDAINFGKHSSSFEKNADASVPIDWYKLQVRILLERNSALNGVYFGYIGIGLYEAVRNGIPNSVSLSSKLYQMPEMPAKQNGGKYDWQVSANAAMAAMVRGFYAGLTPANMTSIDSLENAWNQKLTAGTSAEIFNRSQAYGRSIATAIHDWYLTDDLNATNAGYVPPVFAGAWVPTPPAYVNPPVNPFIGSSRPYLSSDLNVVGPAPIPYSEETNSAFYKMVKDVYDISLSLTPEQKNIALYWVDNGNGVGLTTGGHEIFIITQIIEQLHSDLGTAAEAYAKAGIAERDAVILCFRSKYTYTLIRPVSYIQKLIDPAWLPFIVTPPHPEYPAAHAFVTGSVMQAVTNVLGEHISFTDHSYDFRGWAPRSFNTIFAAAEEAGLSRFYGGIHYIPSINIGLSLGKDLGNRVGGIKLH